MVEKFTIVHYRCEFCSRSFETLHEATEHEALCRSDRFRIPDLMGKWVRGNGVVGMATQTRKADSFIGISTPFSTSVTWISPQKIEELDPETAKRLLSETLEAKIHGFELGSDEFRRGSQ